MPRKLGIDDREALLSISEHAGFQVVLEELDSLKEDIEREVLQLSLLDGDERKLVHAKCRAEGAAKLLVAFERRLRGLKSKQDA